MHLYSVYLLAIAVSALRGGFAPACVALMASVLLAGAHAPSATASAGRIVFALEGLGVAALVAAVSGRVRRADAQVAALQVANGELRGQARRGHLTLHALQHLEDIAPDAAVFLVSAQGLIVEWSGSAERMYGYTDEPIVGSSLAGLFADAVATTDIQALLDGEVSRGAGASIRRAPSIGRDARCMWSSR